MKLYTLPTQETRARIHSLIQLNAHGKLSRVHTYRYKRHWNWRTAVENIPVALVVACVVFGLPLMLFVSCTGR